MKKRILSILFAACLLMTAIPVSAAEVLPTPEAVSENTPTINCSGGAADSGKHTGRATDPGKRSGSNSNT